MSQDLRFPIGDFDPAYEVTEDLIKSHIETLRNLHLKLAFAVEGLNDEQLDTEYRPQGWTVRQVVHHVADSHINAYCRFKLALTEDVPTIKPYLEAEWAKLPDSRLPVDISLKLIETSHGRWAEVVEGMSEADFQRRLEHPESGGWTLGKMLGLYDWHAKHHTAHITGLRERKGWA
jgi:hypothetical protein